MPTRKELLQRHERLLPAGTVVYREGTVGDRMFVIRSGRVELSKRNQNGSTRLAVLLSR